MGELILYSLFAVSTSLTAGALWILWSMY